MNFFILLWHDFEGIPFFSFNLFLKFRSDIFDQFCMPLQNQPTMVYGLTPGPSSTTVDIYK